MSTCTHTGNCPCAKPDPCELCAGTGNIYVLLRPPDTYYYRGRGIDISIRGDLVISTDDCFEVQCPECEGKGWLS